MAITVRKTTTLTGFAFVALLAVGVAWLMRWPRFEIGPSQIGSSSTHIINCGDAFAHGLDIQVSGHLDGSAELVTPHRTLHRDGIVNELLSGEFYESAATIEYVPNEVNDGNLVVKYRFRTI